MPGLNYDTISSGEFYVGKRSNKFLKAFLGSCVGIVLIDKKASVGGLYHILLSEPPARRAIDEPGKYASTGMPLFLEAMYMAGAQKENLKAYVAGGALVGKVSLLDLRLDIGGQTAEVVEKYLALEAVKLERVETGGYLSAQITLNMNTLECTIEPLNSGHHLLKSSQPYQAPPDINQAIKKLRPIPQIALKVIRMINSETSSLSAVAEKIRTDQILTAKVLQLSNSAYINPGRKIASVDQALIYLGEKRVLLLTLAVFSEMFYQQAEQSYSLVKGGLYRHALGVAFIADQIARFTKSMLPDRAYTAGLLHDMGKTALDQFMAKDFPMFYRKMMENPQRSLLELERELFGTDHAEMGKKLARSWNLPEELIDAIAYHHDPSKAQTDPEMTRLVFLANTLFYAFNSGVSLAITDSVFLDENLRMLGLKNNDLKELIDRIPWNKIDKLELI